MKNKIEKVQVNTVDQLTYVPMVTDELTYPEACDVRAPNKSHISVDAGTKVRTEGDVHTVYEGRAFAGYNSHMEVGKGARGVAELPSLVVARPFSTVTVNGGAVAIAQHAEVHADDGGIVIAEYRSKVVAFPGSRILAKFGSNIVLNGCTDVTVERGVTLTTSGVLTTHGQVEVHARSGSLIVARRNSSVHAHAGSRVINEGGTIVYAHKEAVIVDKANFWDNIRLIWSIHPKAVAQVELPELAVKHGLAARYAAVPANA